MHADLPAAPSLDAGLHKPRLFTGTRRIAHSPSTIKHNTESLSSPPSSAPRYYYHKETLQDHGAYVGSAGIACRTAPVSAHADRSRT